MARISRRLIVWVAAALVAVVLLGLSTVVLIVLLIDPDDHKPRIEAMVREQIGREFKLTGKLSWRIAPWLVVESAGGSLGNPDGFEGEPFAAWQRLRLGVQLLPLLRREFVIDRIAIDGLDLRLQRNAAGQDNWTFMTAPAEPDAAEPKLQVDAAELTHSRVSYFDATTRTQLQAEELSASLRLPAGTTAKNVQVEKLSIDAHLYGGPLVERGVAFAVAAPRASYDSATSSLQLPEFTLKLDDATASGAVTAVFTPSLSARGKFDINAPRLRELLLAFGAAVPATRDAGALRRFKLASGVRLDADRLVTEGLTLQLDDTQITGDVQLPSLDKGSIRFDLAGDSIDIDRYLEPDGTVSEPFKLQVEQLKALDAAGQLTFQRATLGGIAIVGLTLKVEGP